MSVAKRWFLLASTIAFGYFVAHAGRAGVDGPRGLLVPIAGLLAILSGYSLLWTP